MATLHILKRRIKAAQNVSKTTRAMQMIAASKLKRAQEAALASRAYVEKLTALTQGISGKIDDEQKHPYLEFKKGGKILLILLAPDKGLCGGLITNLLREFLAFSEKEKEISYVAIGKKSQSVVHLNTEIIASFPFGSTLPAFDMVYPIAKLIDDHYLSGKVHTVKILYTNFASIFSQKPMLATLLPVSLPQEASLPQQENTVTLFEPDFTNLVPTLLKHYLEMSIYQYLLESFVSEQASRMIAMQNATNNARDIIADLQLEYNKSRQSKITNEILDITGSRIKSL